MTKNPYVNAGAAALYILAVVFFMSAIAKPDTPDQGLWAPIMMLSLLTFSVAFMAYAFFFNPVQMYLDGQKGEAAALFTRTLLSFGGITAAFLVAGAFFA
jgi:hypothetical protein